MTAFYGELDKFNQHEITGLLDDNNAAVKLANDGRRERAVSPSQSNFRVFAILIVRKSCGDLCLIPGANYEQGNIAGAICAERAALSQLSYLVSPTILQVIVVSDSENPLSPGVLCREFLSSHADPTVSVVMGNGTGEKVDACKLGDIWPHPYVYRFEQRANLLDKAKEFASKVEKLVLERCDHGHKEALLGVYNAALNANNRDRELLIYPLQLSAAVIFDDGSIETAWQLKGLEYGCTLDPVVQLIHAMEKRRYICTPCAEQQQDSGTGSIDNPTNNSGSSNSNGEGNSEPSICQAGLVVKPVALVMVDQFGVAHAPFAQPRALLTEHGYGYITVLVHLAGSGALETASVASLVPHTPSCPLLSHDDFH